MKYHFYEKRKLLYFISAVLLAVSLVSLLFLGLNQGVEFRSGTLMDIRFTDETVSIEQIRGILAEYGLEQSSITQAGEGTFVIKSIEISEETQNMVTGSYRETLGEYELLRLESIGPIIGKELTQNGILALVIASALMLVYISIRFQWKYAISAILCLIHDSLIMLGFFSVFQFEIEGSFIAAVLTIIGYSINNTIVVFDRVRENTRLHPKWSSGEMVNNSIGQTLVRSINLSVTVALVLATLILFGGETTKSFAIALFVGNVAGFYSSAFIAANLWMDFKPKGIKAA
ncbi:MAG: protein translocase subunit SecF [Clostridiales bacterium]|nr:protein translocase subunit SecF [Clostridiales bacterium]